MYTYGETFPIGYDSSRLETYQHDALEAARASAMSSRNILTMLGDFWTDYYTDTEAVKAVHAGAATLLGEEAITTLRYIFASNIIDFPFETTGKVQMFVFDRSKATYVYDDNGNPDYIDYPMPELRHISVLTDRLFEPNIVIEKGSYFDIIESEDEQFVRFYVDIFQDENILKTVSSVNLDRRIVMLWGSDVLYKESLVYEKYGRFLYKKRTDSRGYHFVITALQKFYISTKSIKNIEVMINILMGVPYARYDGEKLVDISTQSMEGRTYYKITTDRGVYYAPSIAYFDENPPETYNRLDLFCRITTVHDYQTYPEWYKRCSFPGKMIVSSTIEGMPLPDDDGKYDTVDLIADRDSVIQYEKDLYDLIDQVLKYNLIYVRTIYSEEFSEMTYLSLSDITEILISGLPVYLHPIINGSIALLVEDEHLLSTLTSEELMAYMQTGMRDSYSQSGEMLYDGEHFYDIPAQFEYSAKSDYLSVYQSFDTTSLKWSDFFTPDYWSALSGSWNSDGQWDSIFSEGYHRVVLTPAGGWEVDYRPKAVRVRTVDDLKINIRFYLKNSNNDNIAYGWDIESGTELLISATDYDIYSLEIVASWPISISFIEFLWDTETVFDNNILNVFPDIGFLVGSEPLEPAADTYFIIDSTQITDVLNGFPVGIKVDGTAEILTGLGADDWQYLHATVGGKECFVEVDIWDMANDIALLWVRVPEITYVYDAAIKMAITEENNYVKTIAGLTVIDDFTGIDGEEADLDLWSVVEDDCDFNIQSNKLQSSHTAAQNVSRRSKFMLSGDFDIEIDFDILTGPLTSVWAFQFTATTSHATSQDLILIDRRYDGTHKYLSTIIISNVSYQDVASTSNTTGKFRIVRSGSTITSYYDNSGWVQLNTRSGFTDSDLYVLLRSVTSSSMSFEAAFDNFTINSCDGLTGYIGLTGDVQAQNVWDENFLGVWHMSQDPGGGAGCILDSTINNRNGTPSNVVDSVDAPIGKGLSLGTSSQRYVQAAESDLSALQTEYTVESLFNFQATPGTYNDNAIHIGTGVNGTINMVRNVTTSKLKCGVWGDAVDSSYDGPYLQWGHDAVVFSSGLSKLFFNGVEDISNDVSIADLSNAPITIGSSYITAYYSVSVFISETRISDIARSAAWIKATSKNLSGDLVSVQIGGEVPAPSTTDRAVHQFGFTTVNVDTLEYVTVSTDSDSYAFGSNIDAYYFFASLSNGNNGRGVSAGGRDGADAKTTDITYFSIGSTGSCAAFGDLLAALSAPAGTSNKSNERGIFFGGNATSTSNQISFITVNTESSAATFGSATVAAFGMGALSNGINERGLHLGGYGSSYYNNIGYISINSLSDSFDFGDLVSTMYGLSGASDDIGERGITFGGINAVTYYNYIQYLSINTLGNCIDYGDLGTSAGYCGAASDNVKALKFGGRINDASTATDRIEKITIQSTGNSELFGYLSNVSKFGAACSDIG